jgi:site-specific recombinase XerD
MPRHYSEVRSLSVGEWPPAHRAAWDEACRPAIRLKPGGTASHLAPVSCNDIANRYGAFLGFLQRRGVLDLLSPVAGQVTPANVALYVDHLEARVRSCTVWNAVYKLRRAAEMMNQQGDYRWLREIENDLALLIEPKSKLDRLVLAERLVEAGLVLVAEARKSAKNGFERAKDLRNGLMIALLAVCPIRIKNFADLEIGKTLKQVNGRWWITLPASSTKSHRIDERRVPYYLNEIIEFYLAQSRPRLIGAKSSNNWLWISSQTSTRFTTKNLGTLISKITLETVGVDVSPHLFRTAAATTSALYGGKTPHLASAVLGHTNSRVTYGHYTRTSSVNAAKTYAAIVQELRAPDSCG